MDLLVKPRHRTTLVPFSVIGLAQNPFLRRMGTEPRPIVNQEPLPDHVRLIRCNARLNGLVKNGNLDDARNMFDKMRLRDEISWTTMVSGYIDSRRIVEALDLFMRMWVQPGIKMDHFVVSVVLKACALGGNVYFGELLHGYAVKSGFVGSSFVWGALLDMYMKNRKVGSGCRVFDEMEAKDVVLWTAVITGLIRAGRYHKGLSYFLEMREDGVRCDLHTFVVVLKACASLGYLDCGREIHARIFREGLEVNLFVANALATMYNKCGKMENSLTLLKAMPTLDVASWTTVIMSYIEMGRVECAIKEYMKVAAESYVIPDEYTYGAVISGCAGLPRIEMGEQLHAHVLLRGVLGFLAVSNSLMAMYSQFGQMNAAVAIFQEVTWKDVVSWNTMISGYVQAGCAEEAFKIFSLMRREGYEQSEFALASVLSASGGMAILTQGTLLHAYAIVTGLEQCKTIRSALINMYAKCGSISKAAEIFCAREDDEIFSWTSMINACAEHGYSHEAIELFGWLLHSGMKPDSVTYIGILTACSHAGLLELGFHYFDMMRKNHQIVPSKEHYGCMVDLLCRAGKLSEAENMIINMPYEGSDVVWSTLLRACRIQGDVELGKRAAEHLLELEPMCGGTHIALANAYSAEGKWREAADMRSLMKSKGVIKELGWSWIMVGDLLSTFVAGDQNHPQIEDICEALTFLDMGEIDVADIDIY